MAKILVIEDDAVLCETLGYNLEREGYQLITASDGITGLARARADQPDLVLLDLMLPGLDGLSVCRMLRHESSVPIMLLTARREETDRIAGFELGADDYVTKPFSLGELLARIRVHLRRGDHPMVATNDVLTASEIRVEVGSRRVFRNDTPIALSQKEFDLLVVLMRNRGIVLSRDMLLEHVWGYAYTGAARTIDVHIRWLREKVEPDPTNPCYIQTVRGIGYRFDIPPLQPPATSSWAFS